MTKLLLLTGGSIAGGFSRYYVAGFIYRIFGTSFPFGTFVVNMTGCLAIGFLSALSDKKFLIGPDERLLLMIGFCGAYTTFSTFMLETVNLVREGESWQAFLNVTLSVMAGFLILRLGMILGEWF